MNASSFSLSRTAFGLVLACLSAGVGCDTGSKSAVHAPPPAPTVKTVVVQSPSVPAALAQRPSTPPGQTPPAAPAPAVAPAPPPPPAAPVASGAQATQVTPNAPVDPAGTVAVPVPPPLPGPVADVVALARGGVDEGVITEYIANIRQPFAFGASQIVYLNDLGVSSNVLHGLMRQSALLRPEGTSAAAQAQATTVTATVTSQNVTAIPQAAPEPQAPVTTVQGTPPPPPGSATTTVVPPAASPTVVNQQVFYQALAPYGSWVQVPSYGWCWQPTVAVVNTTWQPYCDGGSWLWTDAGWYWSSTYSWGWAPFHYGRWHHSARIGWVWHPGYDWAPAWVAWRSSTAHCGWAPLPPECRWNASIGFSWVNGNTAVSVGFGISGTAWYATTWDRFCDPHLHHHRLPRQRVERFVQESNLQVAGGNAVNIRGDNNTVIINNGISREEVQRHTRDEIRRTALRDVDSPAAAQGLAAGASAATSGRPNPTGGGRPAEVAVYRPKVPVHDTQPPETVLRRQELTRPAPLRAPGASSLAPSGERIGITPSANRPLPVPALGGSPNPNRPAPPTAAGGAPASSLVPPSGPSTGPSRPDPVTGGAVPTERATRTVTPPARPQVGLPGNPPQATTPPSSAPRVPGNPSLAVPSGTGLNPSYRGHFFMTHFKGSVSSSSVYTYTLKPKGASYEINEAKPFLTSALPTDVKFGPDGRLYTADWATGWPKSKRGRIYAISDPKHEKDPLVLETKALIGGDWTKRSPVELARLLGHADWRVRLEAQYELAGRGPDSIVTLAGVAADTDASPLARRHAVWGLGQLAAKNDAALKPVRALLRDADDEVRAQAVNVLGRARSVADTDAFIAALADPAPRAKYFAAQALGKVAQPRATAALFAALRANNDQDAALRHALVMGLVGSNNPAALVAAVTDASPAARLGALLALRRLKSPELVKFLGDSDPALVREAVIAINDVPVVAGYAAIAALLDRPGLTDESILFRALNARFRLGTPADAAALAASPAQTAAFLQEAHAILCELSDRLTQVYFIHTEASK